MKTLNTALHGGRREFKVNYGKASHCTLILLTIGLINDDLLETQKPKTKKVKFEREPD